MAVHQDLAHGRWFSMTLAEQLGNIGSDFERALNWKEKNQATLFASASARTLELTDLTLSDKRWHNHRLKELTRMREEICNVLFGDQVNSTSALHLKKYFLSMASLARVKHQN